MIGPRNRLAWRCLMLVLFAAAALAGVVASVAQGAAVIPPGQVLSILWNPTAQTADQIVWNLRLPRALTGAMVGSNLAVAGAILQAVMRNPLADPHIIGISAGAGITGIAGGVFRSDGGGRSDLCTGLEKRHQASADYFSRRSRFGLFECRHFGDSRILQR